jgi:hypothetical protein
MRKNNYLFGYEEVFLFLAKTFENFSFKKEGLLISNAV